LGIDRAEYTWEKKGAGWRFCGLTEEMCKAACIFMGTCAEVGISSNGCCYPALSHCLGNQRTNDKKFLFGPCQARPPPPPIAHAEWTSLPSLPSITIADAELHATFLSRCKDTCIDTPDCIGFVEADCDQDGCTNCEFKSAVRTDAYVIPATHTYLWLGAGSPFSRASRAKGSVIFDDEAKLDTSNDENDDPTGAADEEVAALGREPGSFGQAGRFTFTATEVAVGIAAAVFWGWIMGSVLQPACVRCCKGRFALRMRKVSRKPQSLSAMRASPAVVLHPD